MSIEIDVVLPGHTIGRPERHHLTIVRTVTNGADGDNLYRVIVDDGEDLTSYPHAYGDGWMVCVEKALHALHHQEWRDGHDANDH